MRSSMGGWLEKRAMIPGLSEMPEDWNAFGSSPGSSPPRRRNAETMGLGVPRNAAAPASARNSRWRENHATMIGRENAEHDLAHDDGDVVAEPHAAFGPEDRPVDHVADDAREEDDEGVHHALDEREGDHVAIGHVGDLVAEHRLDLLLRHRVEKAGRNGDERRVAERARGEGIGLALVDGDLGHADARLFREAPDGADEPLLVRVLRDVDHLRARRPLGHGLRQEERDERPREAHDGGEDDQHPTSSPPEARNRFTPSTLRVTESTIITARLVARNRTMRFMAASPGRRVGS